MGKFLKSSHVVYRCEYHFVWVPKYRSHLKNPLYFLSRFGTFKLWHEKKNYQTSNGQSSNPLSQGHQYGKTEKADHVAQTGKSSTASSGYFVPEHAGMICPNGFHPIRPATGDSRNGSALEYSEASWRRLPLICETVASSISANAL